MSLSSPRRTLLHLAQDAGWQTAAVMPAITLAWPEAQYFGYDRKKAEKLMLEVHNDGRSAVSTGTREEMERDVQAMHEYGLWATMEKAS